MKFYEPYKNENVPRKNSQKITDVKLEDSHPYIAELVENMPKYHISALKYMPTSVGGLDAFYVNNLGKKIKHLLP